MSSIPFPSQTREPLAVPPSIPASPFGPASKIGTSVIGTDLTILGQNIVILSQNRLQIDGDIHGDVAGKEVIISAEGSVVGTVSAERIEVYGGVKGAIRAPSVTLHASAEVDADILHRSLKIDEGAKVDGRMRHPRDESELRPNLDPAAYASSQSPAT